MTELQRLELLDAMIWFNARNALTALAVEHFLNLQFYGIDEAKRKQDYKTNVANTFPYQANSALIDNSIVKIVEFYKAEDKRGPLGLVTPEIDELRKLRIIISHPATIKFSDPDVHQYYKDRRHYTDPKAAQIWKLREVINQKLLSLGSQNIKSTAIQIQIGTIELIHSAISASLNPGRMAPPLPELTSAVFGYFEQYQEAISKV